MGWFRIVKSIKMLVSIIEGGDLSGEERGTNSKERSSDRNSEKMIARRNSERGKNKNTVHVCVRIN